MTHKPTAPFPLAIPVLAEDLDERATARRRSDLTWLRRPSDPSPEDEAPPEGDRS